MLGTLSLAIDLPLKEHVLKAFFAGMHSNLAAKIDSRLYLHQVKGQLNFPSSFFSLSVGSCMNNGISAPAMVAVFASISGFSAAPAATLFRF